MWNVFDAHHNQRRTADKKDFCSEINSCKIKKTGFNYEACFFYC
jgi:hypothetical protein